MASNGGIGQVTFPKTHACHCIGCCKKCGTCRTHPIHTGDYCALVQRQRKEREEVWRRVSGT